MNTSDKEYEELIEALQAFCQVMRKYRGGNNTGKEKRLLARELVNVLTKIVPNVIRPAENIPSHSYAIDVISSAVDGLQMKDIAVLWKDHFLGKVPIVEIAEKGGYSARTLYRRAKDFPELIADQLWRVKLERLTSQNFYHVVSPKRLQTTFQIQISILTSQFNLTTREAEVLLKYLDRTELPIRQKDVAESMHLSLNTIKSHRKSILRKVGSETIDGAIDKAINVLSINPEANWNKLGDSAKERSDVCQSALSSLSARQQQILHIYVKQWPHVSRASVGKQLGVSVETLKKHIWMICSRFKEPNMREVVWNVKHYLHVDKKGGEL